MFGYRELIEKGNYQLILDFTCDSNKIGDLYYRALALALLEDYDGALDIINVHKNSFLEMTPSVRKELFTVHMHCLEKTNDVFSMIKELDAYDSLPYEDYEFEEMLKEEKEHIMANASFNKKEESSDDKLKAIALELENPTLDKVALLRLIDSLRGYDIEEIMPSIKKFLASDYDDETRTYLLLILVSKGTYDDVNFTKNGIEYCIVPYELDPPFDNEYHKELLNEIKELAPNPSMYKVAEEILSIYTLSIYPDNCYEIDQKSLAIASIKVASELLNEYFDIDSLIKKDKLNKNIILALIDDIRLSNSNE